MRPIHFRIFAVFVTLALTGLLPAGCSSPPHPTASATGAELAAKAVTAERAIADRFLSPEGLLVYRRRIDSPPDLVNGPYGNLADGACWSGYFLGAEVLRLKATGTREAHASVERVLSGVELLFDVTGAPGLLARTFDRNVPPEILAGINGEWRQGSVPGYVYRGDVSKDQYAGILFGLGCVLRHSPDPVQRRRAGDLVTAVAERIAIGGPTIRDADGEPTTYGDLAARRLGVPIAADAVLPLTALLLSVHAGGPPAHAERYRALVGDGWARAASFAKVAVFGKTNRNNDHMALAGLYHLVALEEEPEVRELYRRGVSRVARAVRGEGNAFFLGIHLATEGHEESDLRECVSALAMLPVTGRPGRRPGPEGVDGVVPIDMRKPTAFEWRSDPYRLAPPEEPRSQYAPIDFLAAYWLLRAHGLL